MEIYSVLGNKVLETSESAINIAGLANGLYLVKIQAGNKFTTKKLVVNNI